MSTTEHAADPNALIERQHCRLPADNHGALPQRHIDARDHQLPCLHALHQPFDHRLLDAASKRQARVWTGLCHFQLAPGPLTAHQHFARGGYAGAQRQPLQAAWAVDCTNGTGLSEARRPFDTGCHHFARGIAQTTDPDRLACTQPFSHPRACGEPHRLAHHPQGGRCIGERRQRPFVDVEDRDTPCLETTLGGNCLHRYNLPDRQVSTAGGCTVFTHRHVFAIVHFHAIDADRSKPGDGADDAGTTGTAWAQDRRTGTTYPAVTVIKVGAVHTFGHRASAAGAARALRERRASAADTTVFTACTGTACPPRKLQACGTGHAHFVAADTNRCCNHLGRRRQVQPQDQGNGNGTEAAREGRHGPGVLDNSGSVASV